MFLLNSKLSGFVARRSIVIFNLLFVSLLFAGASLVSADSTNRKAVFAIDATDRVLDATDVAAIETALNSGIDVEFSTVSTGTDDGNITIDPITISKSAGPEATLTLIADNDIDAATGFTFESSSGPLNIVFQAAGAIALQNAVLTTSGGDVTMTGRGHAETVNLGPERDTGVTLVGVDIQTGSATPGVAGAITIDGVGNQDSRAGAGDAGANMGVVLVGTTLDGGGLNAAGTAANDITIIGVGGGLPDGDIATSLDLGNYGNANAGVFISQSDLIIDHDKAGSADSTLTPALDITGTGGPGLADNHGVQIGSLDMTISLTDADINIDGTGGGMPASAIRQATAAHGAGANSDLIDDIFLNLDGNNDGVEINSANDAIIEVTGSGDINIDGKGGNGLSLNSGIDISSDTSVVMITAEDGDIVLNGIGGGLDAEAIQGRGPSFILEDPNSVVDTLYERDLSDADLVQLTGPFLAEAVSENYGVSLVGLLVVIDSTYVEPAGIRDLNNNFLTGTFDGGTFTPDRAIGPDNLNINSTRHPDARHVLLTGKGGFGSDYNSGVSIFSDIVLGLYSESADIYVAGAGGGIPNAYISGLIESTKDTTPFSGSDRIDTAGAVANSTLITTIDEMYGFSNHGIDLISDDFIEVIASSGANYPFATRTQKGVGGNIHINGIGGTGQSDNSGVWTESIAETTIHADIGNVDVSGFGGGLPAGNDQLIGEVAGDVFGIQRTGNGRADQLLEIDMTTADLNQIVDLIWEPASHNRGVDIFGEGGLNITSGFKEPPALRQFADGSFGFGTFGPADIAGGADLLDTNNRGDLVLVPAEGDGSYLLADAAGALMPVDNQVSFNVHDYTTTEANGVPVVPTRSLNIRGVGGSGDQRTEGVNLDTTNDHVNITSLAASIDIDGMAGGVPASFTKSIIENVADIDPAAGTDRTDNLFGTSVISSSIGTQDVTAEELLIAVGNLHSSRHRGVDIYTEFGNINITTTLTVEPIWPNVVVTEVDIPATLGSRGNEVIDATVYGLGQVALDVLPQVDISGLTMAEKDGLQAMIAKASDTLLVTANLNRADITIHGTGGIGADENRGVKLESELGELNIIASNNQNTGHDGGNIEIVGHGGGFSAGSEFSPSGENLVHIDNNGITDTLLEVDLNDFDFDLMFSAGFFDDQNEGLYTTAVTTTIRSGFFEPFVPAGPGTNDWGEPVHTRSSDGDLLIARRDIRLVGNGGVGTADNEGIDINSSGTTNIFTFSGNISAEGNGGGMPEIVGRHLIINGTEGTAADLLSDGFPAVNGAIVDGVIQLYSLDNTGVEIRGETNVSIISVYPFISAPNSEVGAIRIVGNGGNGSSANYGVDFDNLNVAITSLMGNIAIVGDAGGFPESVLIGTDSGIDSINELPNLAAEDLFSFVLGCGCDSGIGGANAGVILLADSGSITSGFTEPKIGDTHPGAFHSYTYANSARNPFFLRAGTVTSATLKTGPGGPIRVTRGDIPEIGSNEPGREVVIAGQGGFGLSDNEGIYVDAFTEFLIESNDADVDIDGKGGGFSDAVVEAFFTTHDDGPIGDMNTIIAMMYGGYTDGISFNGTNTNVEVSGKGDIEMNGTGGDAAGGSPGIYIFDSKIEVNDGDIFMVGQGGGVLETFGPTYDSAYEAAGPIGPGPGPGPLSALESDRHGRLRTSSGPEAVEDVFTDSPRSYNFGIALSDNVLLRSFYTKTVQTDPYETKDKALIVLNGSVGNHKGLGIEEVGKGIDITSADYEPDLGTILNDDAGILFDITSGFWADSADVHLYASGDLIMRDLSGGLTEQGNLSAVATRHIELSIDSLLRTQSAGAFNTLAWDLLDPSADSLGRLKVDGTSQINTLADKGEVRMYGYRRGSDPQPFRTNGLTASPYGQPAAYNNEISPTARFNGVTWTDVQTIAPADNSGDHAAEFSSWNQEQWGTTFDYDARSVVASSDRFGGMATPSTYDFGNPGVYTGNYTFFYGQMPTVASLVVDPAIGTEGAETVMTISVTLSLPATGNQTVDLSVSGTDITNGDYTISSNTITFPNGALTSTATLTVTDDLLDELSPETATVMLLNPSAGISMTMPLTTSFDIVDNDVPSVLIADSTVVEASGSAVVTLTLSGMAYDPVTVIVTSADITATGGVDYTAVVSTVTFAVGETTSTLTIPILDDADREPNETLLLTLSDPVSATLGSPMTATVTILDDDPALVFLPIVMHNYSVAADLEVESISTVGGVVKITITNNGNAPVVDSFWLDLFVNPSVIPTSANDTIEQLGQRGLVWGIGPDRLPLNPGESIELTVNDSSFDASRSHLSGGIPAGAALYVHIDSWNSLSTNGAINELHEQSGGSYNNVLAGTAVDMVILPTYIPGVTRGTQIQISPRR